MIFEFFWIWILFCFPSQVMFETLTRTTDEKNWADSWRGPPTTQVVGLWGWSQCGKPNKNQPQKSSKIANYVKIGERFIFFKKKKL